MIIKDIKNVEHNIDGCLGCMISDGRLEPVGGILYKDENFSVSQDFELPINGFIIISTNRHCESLSDLTDKEREKLIKLSNIIIDLLKSYKVSDRFNIILEEKENCHFHVWLMPRKSWMEEKFGKILKHINEIQEYSKTYMKTEENINDILNTCKKLKRDLKNIQLN